MALTWYQADKKTPVSFPFNLGSFTTGDGQPIQFWIYNDGPTSLINAILKIEQDGSNPYSAWSVAKDYKGRPQMFIDYLTVLRFHSLPAYSWTAIWVKFCPDLADSTNNPQSINLRLSGDLAS